MTNPPATVSFLDSARCGLGGAPLSASALRYYVVSPHSSDHALTVCHVCHKAALGEGYRPAEVKPSWPILLPFTGAHGLPFAS